MRTRTFVVLSAAALLAAAASAEAFQNFAGNYPGRGYGYSGYGGTTSYQQAYSMYLGNSKKREQTYFEMRKMNTSFRAEMELQRPHATPEQLARRLQQVAAPGDLVVRRVEPRRKSLSLAASARG